MRAPMNDARLAMVGAMLVAGALIVGAGLLLWSQSVAFGAVEARQLAVRPGSPGVIDALKLNPLARRQTFEELALAQFANAASLAKAGDFGKAARQAGRARQTLSVAISRAPIAANAWIEWARTILYLEGATGAVAAGVRRSYATGPRQGWIAPRRTRLALLIWPVLPAQTRRLVSQEIADMTADGSGAQALAKIYLALRPAALREPLEAALKSAPTTDQRRFLAAVKEQISGRQRPPN